MDVRTIEATKSRNQVDMVKRDEAESSHIRQVGLTGLRQSLSNRLQENDKSRNL